MGRLVGIAAMLIGGVCVAYGSPAILLLGLLVFVLGFMALLIHL